MRAIIFPLLATTLFAASVVHAADMPTQAQIQAAVDKGIAATQAKSSSSMPMPFAIKISKVVGCKPSPEVKTEVVCLVGMSTGSSDAYRVLPLRVDGNTWVGVERKDAVFPPPTPAEAITAMRAWAEQLVIDKPETANDKQIQELRTNMKVKSVGHCGIGRKTGYLECDSTLEIPGKPDVKAELLYSLEGDTWKFVVDK
ncbi:hypothetical protein [Pigmentiphaga aceris]|uniref:hypothetical protein n=1 Tax=Pigmentiphaga aceris TaxID=1940612 RepID=UPI001651E080|nr:hypothetical protein [Pigmentiphaga aceris]